MSNEVSGDIRKILDRMAAAIQRYRHLRVMRSIKTKDHAARYLMAGVQAHADQMFKVGMRISDGQAITSTWEMLERDFTTMKQKEAQRLRALFAEASPSLNGYY